MSDNDMNTNSVTYTGHPQDSQNNMDMGLSGDGEGKVGQSNGYAVYNGHGNDNEEQENGVDDSGDHHGDRSRSLSAPAAVAGAEGGDATVTSQQSSSYSIMNHTFRVDARYSALKPVGKGSFGIVCSASDESQGKRVAIKKIRPMAQHVVDAKHVLREIRLMRYLGAHPNIISLEDLFVSEYHDELYIVMELLDSDLHRIIQSSQALGDAHHRYFMYQLLKGVKFLHDNRIIHRDLKPGNLLVTKSCQLRITDFGLSRLRPMGRGSDPDDEVDHPMTEHVVTRWYRPPELMLCPDGLYGYAVDLWSVGCIFAELLGRQPLFPGKNFMDQLTLIFDVVGSPEPHEVAHIRNQQAKRFLESMQDRVKVPFADLFPSASEPAVDLLEGLLVFDPPGRLTVDEALDHPYFAPLRSSDTKIDPEVPPGFEFDFESKPLDRLQLKNMILQEVESYQRAQRKRDRQARAAAAAAAALHHTNGAVQQQSSMSGNHSANGGQNGSDGGVRNNSGANNSNANSTNNNTDNDERSPDSNEQQQQLQRQRRRRRQAEAAAAAAMAMAADGCINRERAPISAVPVGAHGASEAVTVRAGLGSHRHASHPQWGSSGMIQRGRDASPPFDSTNPNHIPKELPTEPMDDRPTHTPPGEVRDAVLGGDVRQPPTDLRGGIARNCGVSWGGGGGDMPWGGGCQILASAHQHHWRTGERVVTHNNVDNDSRHPHPIPQHSNGSRYHTPQAQGRWPPPAAPVGPLESPVRVRRSAAANEQKYRDAGQGSSGPTAGLSGRGGVGVRGGGIIGDTVTGCGGGVRQMHNQQYDQQMDAWNKKPVAIHEVEHRFHDLHFDRTRLRRSHNETTEVNSMRAPKR